MRTDLASGQACACSSYSVPLQLDEQVAAFYQLRTKCPALHQVTIPDSLVDRHLNFLTSEPDDAYHCSVPFLAYRSGCLPNFTDPLHRFVLDGAGFRNKVTEQYKNDLRETWLFESEEISRFRKARGYLSRLAELRFARWLETQQWQISDLELYGGNFDVEAVTQDHLRAAFEVKFLAQCEVVFELVCDSLKNPTADRLGLYSPIDYLLFRVYEAARQLHDYQTYRVAVAIVSDYDLSFRIPLSDGWIDWENPRFLRRDSEIEQFLAGQYSQNPNLDQDLKVFITALSEVWILRNKGTFELDLAHRIQIS